MHNYVALFSALTIANLITHPDFSKKGSGRAVIIHYFLYLKKREKMKMQEAHHDYNTLVHIEINKLQLHSKEKKVKVELPVLL